MNTTASHRFAALALASVFTLSAMFGIDRLATSDITPAAHVAAAKAPQA